MYVTEKDLTVINELYAFVAGQLDSQNDDNEENAEVKKYWIDFDVRTHELQNKMRKSFTLQNENREIKSRAKKIVSERYIEETGYEL